MHKKIFGMRKIAIILLITILVTFTIPTTSHASFGGKLFGSVVDLFGALGDVIISGLQHFMLGTSSMFDSVMLNVEDPYVDSLRQLVESNPSSTTVKVAGKTLEKGWVAWDGEYDDISIPNIMYAPETIFSNKVPGLDINFIHPNTDRYQSVEEGQAPKESSAKALQEVISTWYVAFRNIAIVGLLSVLVYIGIRIVISSTAEEKSKYKERIMDWVVALCLLFVMHYIMSFVITLTEESVKIFGDTQTIDVEVYNSKVVGDEEERDAADIKFKTTLMGYIRFMAQTDSSNQYIVTKTVYMIIYLVLVVYTLMFTYMYLKRVLYMAFFTMIAPMVAFTYPIDKITDGKAQAFNMWMKEYIFNALMQPMHLALYTMLMGSSMQLAVSNPLYALVAIGFLIPAEKFIRKMFGFEKAQTAGSAGGFATGVLAAKLFNKMRPKGSGKSAGNLDGSSDSGDDGGIDHSVNTSALLSGSRRAGTDTNTNTNTNTNHQSPRDNGNDEDEEVDYANYYNSGFIPSNGANGNNAMQDGGRDGSLNFANTRDNVQYQEAGGIPDGENASDSSSYQRTAPNIPHPAQFDNTRHVADGRGNRFVQGVKAVTNKKIRGFKKIPKKAGRFVLNKGVGAVKTGAGILGGAALAAVPAAVAAVASGGDLKSGMQVMGAGVGLGMSTTSKLPTGDDMIRGVKDIKDTYLDAYRTPEKKKEKKADTQFKKMKNDEKRLKSVRKRLQKDGRYDISPEKWLKDNENIIKEYMKHDVSNIDTIYKAEKMRNESNGAMTNEYAYELARQSDTLGKRINDAGYANSYREELQRDIGANDATEFINRLRKMQE